MQNTAIDCVCATVYVCKHTQYLLVQVIINNVTLNKTEFYAYIGAFLTFRISLRHI